MFILECHDSWELQSCCRLVWERIKRTKDKMREVNENIVESTSHAITHNNTDKMKIVVSIKTYVPTGFTTGRGIQPPFGLLMVWCVSWCHCCCYWLLESLMEFTFPWNLKLHQASLSLGLDRAGCSERSSGRRWWKKKIKKIKRERERGKNAHFQYSKR